MQFPKNFLWVVLILVVALVAYTIGQQGQTVKTINFGEEGFSVEFYQLKDIAKKELEKRQNELERKLSEFQEDFRDTPPNNLDPTNQQRYNLNGTWQSNLGVYYNINQFGNTITVQEVDPIYGITAVGQGIINQRTISINYLTALYTQGTGILQVSDDGRRMDGKFTDLSTGFTTIAIWWKI